MCLCACFQMSEGGVYLGVILRTLHQTQSRDEVYKLYNSVAIIDHVHNGRMPAVAPKVILANGHVCSLGPRTRPCVQPGCKKPGFTIQYYYPPMTYPVDWPPAANAQETRDQLGPAF